MNSTRTTPRALTIVGPGKVGRSLQHAAVTAGLEVQLLDREQVRSGHPGLRPDPTSGNHLTLLAVPDSEIAAACEAICRNGEPTSPIGHLSGATTLAALEAAANAGIATFSLHPLQTFADDSTEVSGIPCAVTSKDEPTRDAVFRFARQLGMEPFELADEDRAVYHAAASIASNFLVCLEQDAAALLAGIGIEDARRLLTPLLEQTLANWTERGPAALTGPIARGDDATVERHLDALRQQAPELIPPYRALAERARAIARLAADQPETKAVAA